MSPSDSRDASDALIGTVFADRYLIQSRLGKGGMAVVYKATDRNLGRDVAVKVLRTDMAPDPVAAKRLIREARAAAALHHPHIISIFDVGERDGIVFVVMEVLVGRPMSDLMEQDGAVTVERALCMGEQIASALVIAHQAGIIHRDIKPENLFLIEHGGGGEDFVKMLDFSIAKLPTQMVTAALTRAGAVFGTPHYMAPEQVEGKQAVPQTDLYALGAVLYELIMGEPPFDGASVIDILLQHVKAPPPVVGRPGMKLPSGLVELVQQLLAKKPADRPQSAAEVRERLGRALAEVRTEKDVAPAAPVTAPTPATPPPLVPHFMPPSPMRAPTPMSEAPTTAITPVSLPAQAPGHAPPAHVAAPSGQDEATVAVAALDDVDALALPDAPPPAAAARKFAGFGDDEPEERTMVGVGMAQMVNDAARARSAAVARPAAPAPVVPPPPPARRAPSPLASPHGERPSGAVEAPSAVHRVPSGHTGRPNRPPPPVPPAPRPANATAGLPPRPANATAGLPPHLIQTAVDQARRPPVRPSPRPPSQVQPVEADDDRVPTQQQLEPAPARLRKHGSEHETIAPAGQDQGRKSLLWLAIPVGVIGLLGLVTALYLLAR